MNELKALIMRVSVFFQDPLPDDAVRMHAEALADLPLERVRAAYNQIARTTVYRKMPLPGAVREIVAPSPDAKEIARDESLILSGRILEAIGKFGSYREREAQLFLGDRAWDAVRVFGGWGQLCGIQSDEMPNIRAQLREYLGATFRKELRTEPCLPEISLEKLIASIPKNQNRGVTK
jgi:hypothetical protein